MEPPGDGLAAFLALLPELRSLRDVIALITAMEGMGRSRNEERGWLIRNKGGLYLLDQNIMVLKSHIINKGCGFLHRLLLHIHKFLTTFCNENVNINSDYLNHSSLPAPPPPLKLFFALFILSIRAKLRRDTRRIIFYVFNSNDCNACSSHTGAVNL